MPRIRSSASNEAAFQFAVLIAIWLVTPGFAAAEEDGEQSPPNAEASQRVEVKVRAPEDSPTPGAPGKRARSLPDTTLIAGPPSDGSPDSQKHQILEFKQRMQELQKAQEKLAHDYQEAMNEVRGSLPRSVQLQLNQQEAKQKLETAQAEVAALAAVQNQPAGAPLPDNAALGTFTLKYVRPEEIGQALYRITGGEPRIAVDERTNTLMIAGSPKQMDVAKQLVLTLDQPGKVQQGKSLEVLQLRIVWLSEGLTDRSMDPPNPTIISPPVADALRELGMELPQVVCQQLTSLTLTPTGPTGKYRFRVPTQIEDSTWEFQGEGTVTATSDDRYAVDFNLNLMEPMSKDKQPSQLSGSILTPLGHYTVMGTTTIVAPAKDSTVGKAQRLSAFVVYLDRPKDFGDTDSSGAPAKKADKKSR